MNTDPELQQMKQLDLAGYFSVLGFKKHVRKSSRLCTVMMRGADCVLISRAPEGHFIWCEANTKNGGSILDAAMQFVPGCHNLGHARIELRPWLGGGLPTVLDPQMQPAEPDRLAVQQDLACCEPITPDHPFLRSRSLPDWIIQSPHLADRVLQDARGNAVFVYADSLGPCGLELRNTNFKGFSEGSVKGLWFAQDTASLQSLVLAESPIDALSVPALAGSWEETRLIAFGGSISELQQKLLVSALEKLPAKCLVRLCFDRDDQGEHYTQLVTELASGVRDDLALMRDPPKTKDYNQDLASVAPTP